MKFFYLGLLILCLLLGGCWLSQRQIAQRTEAVAAPLEEALRAVRSGDAARGRQLLTRGAQTWHVHEGVLASLMSHSYTSEISTALAELEALPDAELERLALRLLWAVRRLAEMEQPVLENVF